MNKTCIICGIQFTARRFDQHCCDEYCRRERNSRLRKSRNQLKLKKKICLVCRKSFSGRGNAGTCDRVCQRINFLKNKQNQTEGRFVIYSSAEKNVLRAFDSPLHWSQHPEAIKWNKRKLRTLRLQTVHGRDKERRRYLRTRQWLKANIDRYRQKARAAYREMGGAAKQLLKESYIRHLLRRSGMKLFPPELIAFKREYLKAIRVSRELAKTIKEKTA